MKRKEARSFAEIFERGIRENGLDKDFELHRACQIWIDIVGATVNQATFKRYMEGSVLHVYIQSSPLKNELMFLRETIVKYLNKALGKELVTDVMIH